MDAVYVSSNQFTVSGDKTSEFTQNRRLKMDCGVDGIKYASVVSSSYSAPNTTINIDESDLTSNLSTVLYGIVQPGSVGSLPDHDHGGSEGQGGAVSMNLLDLNDTPSIYSDGRYLMSTTSGVSWATISGGSSVQSFLDLDDTPTNYESGKFLIATSSGIEWSDVTISGVQMYMARMLCDTNISMDTATAYPIPFNIIVDNVGNMADTSNGRVNITKDGKYLITATVPRVGTVSDGVILYAFIMKNTSTLLELVSKRAAANTSTESLQVTTFASLDEGDYIDIYIRHDNGSTITSQFSYNPSVSVIQIAEYTGGTGAGVQSFIDLDDTPTTYSGSVGKYLRVTASGIEFADATGGGSSDVQNFTDLLDTPTTYSGSVGRYLRTTASGVEFVDIPFSDLPSTDTIASNTYGLELINEIIWSNEILNELISWDNDDVDVVIESEWESNTTSYANRMYFYINTDSTNTNYTRSYIGESAGSAAAGRSADYDGIMIGYITTNSVDRGTTVADLNLRSGRPRTCTTIENRYNPSGSSWGSMRVSSTWENTVDDITSLTFKTDYASTGIIRVYRRAKVSLPMQYIPSGSKGIQSIKIVYKDTDEFYLNPGTIEINDQYYKIDSRLTKQVSSLSADTWYYVYVKPPTSGYDITTNEIEYSTDVPVRDLTKLGRYHSTNTSWRCISAIYSNSSNEIEDFTHEGNYYRGVNSNDSVGWVAFSSSWTTFTCLACPFGDTFVTLNFILDYGNYAGWLNVRNPDSSYQRLLAYCHSANDMGIINSLVDVNSAIQYDLKWAGTTTTNRVYVTSTGFMIPDDVYNGPSRFVESSQNFIDLDDTPTTYSGASGKYLRTTASGIEFVDAPAGGGGSSDVQNFTDLLDTPTTYSGAIGKFLRATASGVEFVDSPLLTESDFYSYELVEEYNLSNETLDDLITGWDGDVDDHLIVEYDFKKNNSDSGGNLELVLNEDNTADNYVRAIIINNGSDASASVGDPYSNACLSLGMNYTGQMETSGRADVYLGSGRQRKSVANCTFYSSSTAYRQHLIGGYWENTTSKVTSLRFRITEESTGWVRVYKKTKLLIPIQQPEYVESTFKAYELVKEWDLSNETVNELFDWDGENEEAYIEFAFANTNSTGISAVVRPNDDTTSTYDTSSHNVKDTPSVTVAWTTDVSYEGFPLVSTSTTTPIYFRGDFHTSLKRTSGNPRISRSFHSRSDSAKQVIYNTFWNNTSDVVTSLRLYLDNPVTGYVRLYKLKTVSLPINGSFLDLSDTPTTYSGVVGKYLRTTASGIEFVDAPTGGGGSSDVQNFLDLLDTPTTYSGNSGKFLVATTSGLEFSDFSINSIDTDFYANELVQEWVLSSEGLDETFTWDGDVDDIIVFEIVNAAIPNGSNVKLRFNDDSSSNYQIASITQDGTSFSGYLNSSYDRILLSNSNNTTDSTISEMYLKKTGQKRVVRTHITSQRSDNTDLWWTGSYGQFWNNTSDKITSFRIWSDNSDLTGTFRLYKRTNISLPVHYVPSGIVGAQSIKVEFKDTDELYINSGTVEINNTFYSVDSIFTKQLISLSASSWYYIYVKPPTSGTTITSSEIEYSTSVPVLNTNKTGYYHSTYNSWRCISAIRTHSDSAIAEFVHSGDNLIQLNGLFPVNGTSNLTPAVTTSWQSYTFDVPKFANLRSESTIVSSAYSSGSAWFYYRTTGVSYDSGIPVFRMATASNSWFAKYHQFITNADGQADFKVSDSYSSSYIYVYTTGIYLPVEIYNPGSTADVDSVQTFIDLTDTPTTYSGAVGKYLRTTASGIEFVDAPTGGGSSDVQSFLDLTDTPTTYSGISGYTVTVVGSGLQFTPSPISGYSPVGAVGFFAMEDAPDGWLICDGSALNKVDYPELYAVIQNIWGGTVSGTMFNIPDLRSEFIRGAGLGRGHDGDHAVGTHQDASEHMRLYRSGSNLYFSYENPDSTGYENQRNSATTMPYTTSNGSASVAKMLGYQSRPTNIALLPCIKYTNNVEISGGSFIGMSDTPTTYSGASGKYLMATSSGITFVDAPTGGGSSDVQDFLDLTDTPTTYSGTEGFFAKSTGSGIEWYDIQLDSLTTITDLNTCSGVLQTQIDSKEDRYSTTSWASVASKGVQSIKIEYKDVDEIYLSMGTLHIDTGSVEDYYTIPSQISKQLSSLSISTWYYIYIKPPSSGYTITDSEVEYSSTAPTKDVSKLGYYHPTNTSWRCVGFIYSDSSGNITEFVSAGDYMEYVMTIYSGFGNTTTSTWTALSLSNPLPNIANLLLNIEYNIYENDSASSATTLSIRDTDYQITHNLRTLFTSNYSIYFLGSLNLIYGGTSLEVTTSISITWDQLVLKLSGFNYPSEIYTGPTKIGRTDVGDFLTLTDTPTTYSGSVGKYLRVTASGIEFAEVSSGGGSSDVQSFLDLDDTPITYSGSVGKYLRTTASGVDLTDELHGTYLYVDGNATITGTVYASAYDSLSSLVLKAGGNTVMEADDTTGIVDFKHGISINGLTISGVNDGSSPVGSIIWHAAETAPDGYLICDGSAISRSTYSALYSVIGTLYGVGDDSTTFNIPDLRSEFIRGAGLGRGLDGDHAVGTTQSGTEHLALSTNLTPTRVYIGYESYFDISEKGGEEVTTGSVTGSLNFDATTDTYLNKTYRAVPRNVALLPCIRYNPRFASDEVIKYVSTGKQSIKVEYATTSGIYVNPGEIHLKTTYDVSNVLETRTYVDAGLTAGDGPDIFYVYASVSGSNLNFDVSSTEPTIDYTNMGWYSGNSRCIGSVYVESGGVIKRFKESRGSYNWLANLYILNSTNVTTTPTDISWVAPVYASEIQATFYLDTYGANGGLYYTDKDSTDYIHVVHAHTSGRAGMNSLILTCDSNQQGQMTFSVNSTNACSVRQNGYIVPEYIYTGA